MADNIRDVYSVVFTSLGEDKLVQDLNKINTALKEQKNLLKKIGSLPGLTAELKNGTALKRALNTINARIQAEKKASLKRLKMIDTEEKIERKEEAIKNRKLAFVQKVISQELALYRQLEVEKAKIMAKYGQLPASLQSLKAPLPPKYTFEGATNIRQKNIPNYRQAMQDAKLFVVEQNKLKQQEAQRLATQRQQTAEANRQLSTARQQTAELSKQLSLTTKISNGIVGMKKGLQKLATDSFVFQRIFDSITRTIDEWSKANIAMSQFRSQAGFENMNRQLNETVTNLGHVISKYEVIPAINKAKMLGFDFSGNKLSETLLMTTKVAQMFNIDPTKAFADFTVAITKASPIIMDNVGVLLRLEEAYRMNYETTYKGVDAYDKWEKKLTQAQKREIYYTESMKQFAKKTEGFIVMTNKAQSAIMRLRDAWLGLGNDLSDSGGLNPAIFLIEKVVSLFEALGRSIYQLSNQFQALINNNPLLQKLLYFMMGSTGMGFVGTQNLQDVQEQYKYQMPITQSNAAKSKAILEQVAINPIRKMQEAIKNELKYEESWNKNALTQVWNKKAVDRAMNYKTKIKELTAALNELNEAEKKITDTSDKEFVDRIMQGGILNLGDLLSKSSQVVKKYELQAPSFDKTGWYSRLMINLYENTLPDSAAEWMNNGKPLGDFMADYQAGQKAVQDLNKEFANSNLVLSGVVNKYKEFDEALTGYIKTNREDLKLSAEKFKEITKLEKLGAEFALAVEKKGLTGDIGYQKREEVRNLLTQYNPNVKAEGEDMYMKFFKSYGVARDADFTDAETGLIKIIGVGDKVEKLEAELKDKLYKILNNREMVDEIVAKYKLAQEAGSAYGVLKNITTYLDPLKEKKDTSKGRSKAPKEFWDKWYEMNRTAFTETLPEGITRDIEQARLDWYDQVKNLENLKKDILQAKKQGRLDPEENLKFFGPKGNDPKVFENQMKAFRDTIENNYSRMLDKMSKELQERLNEINPFQQFSKDANLRQLEERGKYLSENPAQGGIASWNIGNKNSAVLKAEQYDKLKTIQIDINRIKYANELKTIEKEKLAIEEEARKNIQAQTQLEIANLEAFKQGDKEWKDTAEFKIKKDAILKKYADMELLAMQDINNQYAERKKWTANILLDNSLTLGFLNKEREAVEKIAKTMADWNRQKNQYRAEDERVKSKFANENPDITAYGFNAMGFGETEESIAMKMGGAGEKVFNDLMKSRFSSLKMFMQTYKTDTAFNFRLGGEAFELLGEDGKERLRAEADAMTGIFTDALDAIKKAVGDASGFWKQALAEMFSGVANFAGNMAWNAITGEDVSGVQALREARKTDLKDQQEQLKNKSITQETYAKRAYEIEKTYIENKKAAEKNYRNEQWKQLGAVFWAQGMGYMIKGGIDMFIPGMQATGQAELAGGAALMALGAMLGYGRGGKKAMSKANMAEESKATKQDINVYVDNKIFEDKRQLKQAINNASV